MLITPIRYWRAVETPLVLEFLSPKKDQKILDIGSPKLLSLYIAKKFKAKIISSDIHNYFTNYCIDFSKVLGTNKNYHTKIIDARKIKLNNNSLDKVYSLSVFEHIPGNGDIRAVKEVRRILKKEGILILTLPFGAKFQIEFRNPKNFYYSLDNSKQNKKKVFYQRIYDEKELLRRIIKPSNMKVISKTYVTQKFNLPIGIYLSLLGPLNIMLSKVNHIKLSENNNTITKKSIVHLVLKK